MKDSALRALARYLSVFAHYKRINFSSRLAYRFNFLMILMAVIFQVAFNLVFIRIIFGWVGDIGGWNYYEAMLVVGSVMLLDGLMWSCFGFIGALKMHIKQGTLDGLLVKPMDGQYLVSIYRGDLEDVGRLAIGLGVVIYGIWNLSFGWIGLTGNLFWYLLAILCGWSVIYSIALMLASVSFWTIETPTSSVLADAIVRSSQYPADIFGKGLIRQMITFVVPLAFLGTVPARILAHGLDPWLIMESIAMAAAFLVLSRWVWNKGLAQYSSASS